MFPINSNLGKEGNTARNKEIFEVNFARTKQYRKSNLPNLYHAIYEQPLREKNFRDHPRTMTL
jgi:hypothetical protein